MWPNNRLSGSVTFEVPAKSGFRASTPDQRDRRDAQKLACSYRSGDLTEVWVPDEGSEALRDLVRTREAAKRDQLGQGIG
jgi:transposase